MSISSTSTTPSFDEASATLTENKKNVPPRQVGLLIEDADHRLRGPQEIGQIGIDLAYLLDAVNALGFEDINEVELRSDGELDPIRIDGPRGAAVVMPMRP